jgi:hypothetical protein
MRGGVRGTVCSFAVASLPALGPSSAAAQENQPPSIRLDAPACGVVAARTRVCAYVVDETGVAQVRVSFRAPGARGYHWTPMSFDGALYCAWLPAPLPQTRAVEYYVEAVDDKYEPSRSADHSFDVRSDCPVQGQPPPAAPAVVGTTSPGQPAAPEGFDPGTFKPR